ncbi:MAG: DNA primase [Terracidiphilus sp.]
MSDFAQSVKQQADIVKVIEGYIRLRKAGAQRFTGLCPFHKEKTPSFSVHAGQQFFYCFGCQATGDVFSFVGKIENVGFPEAVRIVAQKCGIPLPKREFSSPEEAAGARMRTRLLELHETAAAWFEEQLRSPGGALAREYLAGRGLVDDGIRKFRIGYAPDSFNALRDRLSGMADEETLRVSGLFASKEQGDGSQGPIYDRFRKRVVFPIANEGGRVIAFTARTLETGDKAGAKYINSPETPLYSKGNNFFNLDKARNVIRQAGFALLVEGQMDCISVYLRGVQNVIATSGTAFTEQHVAILRRHTSNVVVNFDADSAGENAVEKFADKIAPLIEEGFSVRVVSLGGGLDPDRFIRERGVGAYVEAVRGASGLDLFLIERARQMFPGGGAEQKVRQMNYLLPHIRRIPQKQARIQFARDASVRLNIDSAVLREELEQAARHRLDQVGARIAGDVANLPKGFIAAPDVLRDQVIEAASIGGGRAAVRGGRLTEVERVLLRALAITDPEGEAARRLAAEAIQKQPAWFEHLGAFGAMRALATRAARDPMDVVEDPAQRALLAEVLLGESRPPTEELVIETLAWHEANIIEGQLRQIRLEMGEVERQSGWEKALELNLKRSGLERRLSELKTSGSRGRGNGGLG